MLLGGVGVKSFCVSGSGVMVRINTNFLGGDIRAGLHMSDHCRAGQGRTTTCAAYANMQHIRRHKGRAAY